MCSSDLEPVSDATIEALLAELVEIRKQGFATGIGERNRGVCGVAAPIFDHSQKVVASLGVSGPLPRFNMELALQYGPLVKSEADKISTRLGARRP